MRIPPPASAAKKVALLLGTLMPVLFTGYVLLSQEPSAEMLAASISLDGAWKVLPGDTPGGELPGLDDARAPEMTVPGQFERQGFKGAECWLRRRFDAPPALRQDRAFLILGGTRTGFGRFFINGVPIGETQSTPHGLKGEISGREGWLVPAELLKEKDNVLAVHFTWGWPGLDGINNEVLLGPASILGKYYEQAGETRRAIQYGAASLMVFLLLLFGALLAAQWGSPNRSLYLACIGFIVAATFYMGAKAGIFFRVSIQHPAAAFMLYLSVLGIFLAQPEFIGRYLYGPRSRFRRWNVSICTVLFVLLVGSYLFARPERMTLLTNVIAAYGLVPVLYFGGVSIVHLVRNPLGMSSIFCSSILCCVASGTVDLFQGLGLISFWSMYALGISASAITAGAVLIADFTKVAFDNQILTHSLKKTNAELADALVRAQEAARLKSEFVASVSHELRTPLNSVLNIPEGLLEQFSKGRFVTCEACEAMFELEAEEALAPGAVCSGCGAQGRLTSLEEYRFVGHGSIAVNGLRQVHRAGKHLLSLIDDVLDFSKLEAGRMTLSLETVEVADALQNVVDTLTPIAKKKDVSLVVRAPAEGRIRVDPVKLAQIFINLVGNAVKFSPEGSKVELRAAEEGADWILAVVDHGIGIAPEHHKTIFESFRQVDGGNTRKFGGTGLGLAITRKLTESHGGVIWVESALGKGSSFFVRLPREGPAESTAAPLPSPLPASAQGRTLLILDDERFAVENLKLALQPLGHRVEGIEDPRLLENALAELKPDLLILDVMLPGLSGIDILRMLIARKSTLPVLVSSAYSANMDIVRELGASWIAKPWRSDEIQEEVTRLLLTKHLEESEGTSAETQTMSG